MHFLDHLLDEPLAMVHTSYVLQLYNVRSAKRTSFAYKPYTPNGRQKIKWCFEWSSNGTSPSTGIEIQHDLKNKIQVCILTIDCIYKTIFHACNIRPQVYCRKISILVTVMIFTMHSAILTFGPLNLALVYWTYHALIKKEIAKEEYITIIGHWSMVIREV